MDRRSCASKAKVAIQNNPVLGPAYRALKERKDAAVVQKNLDGRHVFDNRSGGSSVACIVLAGYKPYLYPYVLPRLALYAPKDMDVCVVTAGKVAEPLRALCEHVGWSYVGTYDNNVALAQNIAISLLPEAKQVFKLDEDIFVTEGFFQTMLAAREHALLGDYRPGALAPLLPVNGYGHVRILRRFGLEQEYERRFERPLCTADPARSIERDPRAARFMWGEGGVVPGLDKIAEQIAYDPMQELPCAIRFSIGAMLLERDVWEAMGCFDVYRGFVGLGLDERQLCAWCAVNSRPIMVSENAVAGHFAFGSQNEGMREFLREHPEAFEIARAEWQALQ